MLRALTESLRDEHAARLQWVKSRNPPSSSFERTLSRLQCFGESHFPGTSGGRGKRFTAVNTICSECVREEEGLLRESDVFVGLLGPLLCLATGGARRLAFSGRDADEPVGFSTVPMQPEWRRIAARSLHRVLVLLSSGGACGCQTVPLSTLFTFLRCHAATLWPWRSLGKARQERIDTDRFFIRGRRLKLCSWNSGLTGIFPLHRAGYGNFVFWAHLCRL